MKNKGITLIALVITIVILIILAGVAISLSLGENGIFRRAETTGEEYNKKAATEAINLKITTCQIQSYEEKGELPTLSYLAAFLQKDKETIGEIEYVEQVSKRKASLDDTAYTSWDKIYTKLKAYPYEFEINSQLQLASINGVQVASTNIPEGYVKPEGIIQITEPSEKTDVSKYQYADTSSLCSKLDGTIEIFETGTYTSTNVGAGNAVLQTITLKNNYIEEQNVRLFITSVNIIGSITPYIDLKNADGIGLAQSITGNTKQFYLWNGAGTGSGTITLDYAVIRINDTNNE